LPSPFEGEGEVGRICFYLVNRFRLNIESGIFLKATLRKLIVVTSSFTMAFVMTILDMNGRGALSTVILFSYSNVAVLNIFPETV
jgi:hypothetical protein